MTGFDFRLCHGVIGALYEGLQSGRLTFPEKEGKLSDVITNDYQVLLRPVPYDIAADMATWSFGRPGNEKQEAWHLIMPDPNHKFPGDPGCGERYEGIQAIDHFAQYGSSLKPH